MNIEKIQSSTNFGKLYMPSKESLVKYGEDFARKAEMQRPGLKELAKEADIFVSVKSSPEPKDMFQALFATVRPTITRLLDAKYPKQLDYFAVKIVKDSPEKSIEKLVANVDELYETIAKNLKV
jgi:hypothetical protein